MTATFKKLNFKGQKQLYILNVPAGFAPEMEQMSKMATLKTTLTSAKEIEFFLGFVTKQNEVNTLAARVATLLTDDGLFWFAYPKGTSKKHACEFKRDTGWNVLGQLGFEGVRMIAIDEDWSALRFRRAEHIKKMTRSFALSDIGKKKAATGKKRYR